MICILSTVVIHRHRSKWWRLTSNICARQNLTVDVINFTSGCINIVLGMQSQLKLLAIKSLLETLSSCSFLSSFSHCSHDTSPYSIGNLPSSNDDLPFSLLASFLANAAPRTTFQKATLDSPGNPFHHWLHCSLRLSPIRLGINADADIWSSPLLSHHVTIKWSGVHSSLTLNRSANAGRMPKVSNESFMPHPAIPPFNILWMSAVPSSLSHIGTKTFVSKQIPLNVVLCCPQIDYIDKKNKSMSPWLPKNPFALFDFKLDRFCKEGGEAATELLHNRHHFYDVED